MDIRQISLNHTKALSNISKDIDNEAENIKTKEEIIDISDKTFGVNMCNEFWRGLINIYDNVRIDLDETGEFVVKYPYERFKYQYFKYKIAKYISDIEVKLWKLVKKFFSSVNSSSVDSTGEVMGVAVDGLARTTLSVAANSRPDDLVEFSYQVVEFY